MAKTPRKNSSRIPRKNHSLVAKRPNIISGLSSQIKSLLDKIELLTQERDLLKMLHDTTPDRIYFKDRNSRFIMINRAQADYFALTDPAAAIGKTDRDFFSEEHARQAFEDEQQILGSGKPIVAKEEKETWHAGQETWALTTKLPFRNKDGEIIGTCGISQDITILKKAETEIIKAKEDLELRVQERTSDLKTANELLYTRLEQLKFLNTTSFQFAQFIRLDELCPSIVDAFVTRFGKAEAALCLCHESGGYVTAHATELLTHESALASAEKNLVALNAARLQGPYFVEDWKKNEIMSALAWGRIEELRSFIAIPLLADNRVMGVVQIFTEQELMHRFSAEMDVLMTLATQAAACISNAVHYQELGEQARMLGELDAARSIQQRFVPKEKPSIPHVNLKGVYYPAFEVGGDYLDYFMADNGNWVVVVADVCGKGVPAALFMTMLRSAFRIQGRQAVSARELLCNVNDAMIYNLDDRSFVTVICSVIAADGSSMTYARAGHPMLIHAKEKGCSHTIHTNGLALGLAPDSAVFSSMIDELTIPLRSGDAFVMYTDGLSEATDPAKAPYGSRRLLDVMADCHGLDSESIVDRIMRDVREFTHGLPPHDDLTLLAMQIV
jgi:PAS domain S-box-containing protein